MIDKSESPLSNAAFRRVWIGATVSAAGDAASWVALVAYAFGLANGSVAILAVLSTAPVAVGGLVAGWALDRYDRRRLLVGDSLVRAAVFGTVPLAAVWGGLTDVQLYLVAGVYGLLKMTSLAGFPALIPELVPPGQLMAANALESVSFGIAGLVGAVGAGVAVATVGPGYVVAFDVLSYVIFALCLIGTRTGAGPARAINRPATVSRRGGGLGPVLRLMVREPVLRDTTKSSSECSGKPGSKTSTGFWHWTAWWRRTQPTSSGQPSRRCSRRVRPCSATARRLNSRGS